MTSHKITKSETSLVGLGMIETFGYLVLGWMAIHV